MDLVSRLERLAECQPDQPAFIYQRSPGRWEVCTFAQLLDKTRRLVRGLRALGLSPGVRVALMAPASPDFFALVLALLRIRAVSVMVDPAIGLKTVATCYAACRPEVYIGNGLTHAIRRLFGWGRDTLRVNTSLPRILRAAPDGAGFETDGQSAPDDDLPAVIMYTSGSTGLPKGAVYTHGNLAAQLALLGQAFDITSAEIDLPAFPVFALIDCLLGVTAVIPDLRFPAPALIDPAKVFGAVNRFHVTHMFASPVALRRLAVYGARHSAALPSLRRVVTAGAPAPVPVLEEFWKLLPETADLLGIYGATEALAISIVDSREILAETRYASAQGAGICVGRPVPGMGVHVIGISDAPIAEWRAELETRPGEVGEITVSGPGVTPAYVDGAEANRLAKIRAGEVLLHRTGDLGYLDAQGRLWYCGRKTQRVETAAGVWFTEQIEGVFNAHPAVYRTALVGVNREPILWVEATRDLSGEAQRRLARELASLAQGHPQAVGIRTFLFLKKFPTDVRHNSKIIREKLTVLARGRTGPV